MSRIIKASMAQATATLEKIKQQTETRRGGYLMQQVQADIAKGKTFEQALATRAKNINPGFVKLQRQLNLSEYNNPLINRLTTDFNTRPFTVIRKTSGGQLALISSVKDIAKLKERIMKRGLSEADAESIIVSGFLSVQSDKYSSIPVAKEYIKKAAEQLNINVDVHNLGATATQVSQRNQAIVSIQKLTPVDPNGNYAYDEHLEGEVWTQMHAVAGKGVKTTDDRFKNVYNKWGDLKRKIQSENYIKSNPSDFSTNDVNDFLNGSLSVDGFIDIYFTKGK